MLKLRKKNAIIVGVNGQDGKILHNFLLNKNYIVTGLDRSNINLKNKNSIYSLIKKNKPSEVYYLAAFHHSSQDKPIKDEVLIKKSYEVNVLGLLYFLEAIKLYSSQTKIFYAASSLLFGQVKTGRQTENSPFKPNTVYGATKLEGLNLCKFYREQNNIFVSVGILFNHESAYRSDKFITLKIIKTALAIKNGKAKKLKVGDLAAAVDWGYAPDFVEAFWKILNSKKADDYIVATGKKHTVKQFIIETFKQLGLDWAKYVVEKESILTRQKAAVVGDFAKLRKATGWKPKTSFSKMIGLIITDLQK